MEPTVYFNPTHGSGELNQAWMRLPEEMRELDPETLDVRPRERVPAGLILVVLPGGADLV